MLHAAMTKITKEQAIAAFGGSIRYLAESLGITPSAVYLWPDGKPIPKLQAMRLRFEIKPEIFGESAPQPEPEKKAA